MLNPALQLAAFTMIGSYIGSQPASYYAVGNAVHSMARASIFSATVVIGAERSNGTLSTLLATPSRPIVIFGGRLIPALVTGYLSSIIMLALATTFTGATVPLAGVPMILLTIFLVALSCSALGLCLGAASLYLRDVFFLPNVSIYGMMLFCGVNLTSAENPAGESFARLIPLTNGLHAIREVMMGHQAPLSALATELGLATVYALVAMILVHVFAQRARVTASLDLGA
ncbi:ABC transporter permease [Phytomonospora sp. NPDC050363]|uniref:ABC transporter permease n=1 Tax=Phytomonospora sp. NPDC050363 TaxID=3155642 RepID=UPI0033C96C50